MDRFITPRLQSQSGPRRAGDVDAALPPGSIPTVQIYLSRLDVSLPVLDHFCTLLNREERARAGRFYFDRNRHRFIAARALLRTVLGQHLGLQPAELEFRCGPTGKPALAADLADTGLHFNLAHSEDLAALAVATAGPVGIDLEHIRRLDDYDALVDQFFSTRESALFHQLSAAEKPAAFFALWTRKEAWLKATGEGIGRFLNRVEVTFLTGEPVTLLALPPGYGPRQWQLRDLPTVTGCAAALALRTSEPSLGYELRHVDLKSGLGHTEGAP
jgi:4'-phosphopantetheinyl transferase